MEKRNVNDILLELRGYLKENKPKYLYNQNLNLGKVKSYILVLIGMRMR